MAITQSLSVARQRRFPRRASAHTAPIVGAGPAGLAAGLALAQAGSHARIFERRTDIGSRYHGDFQGIENWSTEIDAMDELASIGIEPSFEHRPVSECVMFDATGREYAYRSPRPLWYLVRRGSGEGTLDRSLERQARASGVELSLGETVTEPPAAGVVTSGPRRTDMIVAGYVGRTGMADGAFGVMSDAIAPGGYAYLLIWGGHATLAICVVREFRSATRYLRRAAAFFRARVGLALHDARAYGGFGGVAGGIRLRSGNTLFAGEAAGLQDALFGFGIRCALVSGHLAGRSWAAGDPAAYERACRARLGPFVRAAVVNRFLYDGGGVRAQLHLLRGLAATSRPREYLRRYYAARWWTPLIHPVAAWWARRRARPRPAWRMPGVVDRIPATDVPHRETRAHGSDRT